MKLKAYGTTYKVKPYVSKYVDNNNTSVSLLSWDEEYQCWLPYCALSVNIVTLRPGYCAIDTNNCPFAEEFIKENQLGRPTGETVESGYCTYPIYSMDIAKLRDLARRL